MYSRSLLRFRCLSLPHWTVAYVGSSAKSHGGKDILAKTAKGGRATLEKLLVRNSVSLALTTSWTSGWDGWTQWGVSGAIVRFRGEAVVVSSTCWAGQGAVGQVPGYMG